MTQYRIMPIKCCQTGDKYVWTLKNFKKPSSVVVNNVNVLLGMKWKKYKLEEKMDQRVYYPMAINSHFILEKQ